MMNHFAMNQYLRTTLWALILIAAILFSTPALAQVRPQDELLDKTLIAALDAATPGPAEVKLLDQGVIKLPKNFIFVPHQQAAALLAASGNQPSDTLVGLILPEDSAFQWMLPVDFVKSGYIEDNEVSLQQPDIIMQHLQASTTISNQKRLASGFPTISIKKWLQEPFYRSGEHQLIWSLQGEDSEAYRFVNYTIDILGREGYFEFTMLTREHALEQSTHEAEAIITTLRFNDGKRYSDYVKGMDKTAAYDIESLIIGMDTAKKTNWISHFGEIGAALIVLLGFAGWFIIWRRRSKVTVLA